MPSDQNFGWSALTQRMLWRQLPQIRERHFASYLEANRLSDILAAIQAMGSNENFRQTCEQWARVISGPQARENPIEDPINDQTDDQTDDQIGDQTVTKEQTNRWKIVFDEHPEFFRRSRMSSENKERYSLIWRRAVPYAHMENKTKILLRDYRRLSPPDKKKEYWRPPLSDSAIQTLMDIAIKNYVRAVEDKRWLFQSPFMSGAGAFLGAVIAFVGLAIFHPK